jgi:hypothetical protein
MVTIERLMKEQLIEHFVKEFLKSKNLACDTPRKFEFNMANMRCTYLELELKWFLYSKGFNTPPIKRNSNRSLFAPKLFHG